MAGIGSPCDKRSNYQGFGAPVNKKAGRSPPREVPAIGLEAVLKLLARTEADGLARGDADLLARTRVEALTGFPLPHNEGSEAHELDFLILLLQTLLDASQYRVQVL